MKLRTKICDNCGEVYEGNQIKVGDKCKECYDGVIWLHEDNNSCMLFDEDEIEI